MARQWTADPICSAWALCCIALSPGRLPYDEAPGRGGTVRLQVPLLPLQLSAFQGVLGKLLAASPERRYQSGAELVTALDQVRIDGLVPDAVVRTEAIATAEIETAITAGRRQGDRHSSAPSVRHKRLFPLSVLVGLLAVAVGGGHLVHRCSTGWRRTAACAGRSGGTSGCSARMARRASARCRSEPRLGCGRGGLPPRSYLRPRPRRVQRQRLPQWSSAPSRKWSMPWTPATARSPKRS